MDKEFVVTITGLYRKFKEKDRSIDLFRHYLACLALKYAYDARHLPTGPVAEAALPRELITLFKNSPPPAVATILDSILVQLGQLEGDPFKNLFTGVSFSKWVGKGDPVRQERLVQLVEDMSEVSFGPDAEAIRRNAASVGYLLEKYAEENFHKAGFLYTPRSLATLMVRLTNPAAGSSVYDPACGLGNLLVQAARHAALPATALFGAEPDENYRCLAHFNLFFNGLPAAQVSPKGSLAESRKARRPAGTYDCVLLHPPFADLPLVPNQGEDLRLLVNGARNGRPKAAVDSQEDFLSLLLRSLNGRGRAAMIVPHGVLFKAGSAYQARKVLVDHNLIEAVVDLPPNIFYSCKTNVAILILDQAKSHSDVLFVDASTYFEPDRRRNKMRPHHVDDIVQVYRTFSCAAGVAGKLVIRTLQGKPNDYNLTPKRYVRPEVPDAADTDLCSLRQEMEELSRKLGQMHAQLERRISALAETQ